MALLGALPAVLPQELEERVQSEMKSGERLVWVGQPRPGYGLWRALPVVIFAVPWTAFAVFWVYMAGDGLWHNRGNLPGAPAGLTILFPLFGVPFVLVGLSMLSSPFWIRLRMLRTCYALTDRRAIVWEPVLFRGVEVRSYRSGDLIQMSRTERPDGSGDLVFEEEPLHYRRGLQLWRRGFLGIEGVREVEELVMKTLLKEPGR